MKCPKLNPQYISGLVEGEGCFHVSFNFRKKLKVGIETRPSFSISLNRRDLALLQAIHQFFDCGAIRFSSSDGTYKYESRSVKDLVRRIIPHFQKFELHGSKHDDFVKFAEICKSVNQNRHLNPGHLKHIIDIAYQMNPSGKRKHEKKDLLKVIDKLMV